MSLFDFWTESIAIDLGTANTLIIHNDKVVVDSPSIVAIDKKTDKIIAVGAEASLMQGKTHENIKTVRPLKDGVIADFNRRDRTSTRHRARRARRGHQDAECPVDRAARRDRSVPPRSPRARTRAGRRRDRWTPQGAPPRADRPTPIGGRPARRALDHQRPRYRVPANQRA